MATLVYSPQVSVRIFSTKLGKVVDLTDDIINVNVVRSLGPSVSTMNCLLSNGGRKYDGMFSPMDRFVVYMRRLKPMLVMSGYLDSVPLFSAIPSSVSLSGSCTLKLLQNFFWDPGSPAAFTLFHKQSAAAFGQNDGGLALRTIDLLTEVAGWDKGRVHIGAVPRDWFDRLAPLAKRLVDDSEAAQMALEVGSDAYLGGESPSVGTYSQVQGIGPGTGTLPATRGKISQFGGPSGGAYGEMALTGESGVNPRDDWYCAMRWPYVSDTGERIKGVDLADAKGWWANRRIMVVAPRSNKAVVLRAADWGPHVSTNRVIDVSPAALRALGLQTDDYVQIAFASEGAPLGPVDTTNVTLDPADPAAGGSPEAITGGWGAAGDSRNMRTIKVKGRTFTVHRLAVAKFTGFVTDLVDQLGYQPKVVYGFNDRVIEGTTTKSNHAWGAAIDIDPEQNKRYASAAGGPYALPHPPAIVQLARKWGLGWGGEWKHSKDYMHFEVLGAPSSGDYAAVSSTFGPPVPVKWTTPVKEPYEVTSRFGDGGTLWAKGHSGTDFAVDTGTPIRPVGPGVIHNKGTGDPSYGNWISVDHGKKVYTFYAHMEFASAWEVGQAVTPADTIGLVGQTGNATGPHVHLELRLDADTYDAALASGGIEKYVLGDAPPPRGVEGTVVAGESYIGEDGVGGGGFDASTMGGGLLNAFYWLQSAAVQQESLLLTGYRALMNDEPILNSISEYMGGGFRDFCSAPNGDFIAWFPDYFGHHKMAGKMVITPLEIDGVHSPPSITWSDSNLKTHQFVIGTPVEGGSFDALIAMWGTAGIASVEFPEILAALLNVTDEEARDLSETMLARYGARPTTKTVRQIAGGRQEFYFACMEFMKNWSAQFRTSITVKFMPEIYPGMLVCIPAYGIQGYVQEVTHNCDTSGGFTTSISAAPWSTMGRQDKAPALPKGAPL